MPLNLKPERGLLFRITHIANLPWLLANGLHCANGAAADPNFVPIGNPDLIAKRPYRPMPMPPGGTLSDYVPFYFTPKSPMLLNIKTGYGGIPQRDNDDIIILMTSIPTLVAQGVTVLFTDRHAYKSLARFSADPADLSDFIDWDILMRSDFARSDEYPDKMERYQAEGLAHQHVPVAALMGIACASEATRRRLEAIVTDAGLELTIFERRGWYF